MEQEFEARLDKYGLTREEIVDNGEIAEFEPVDNPKKEKSPMVLMSNVTPVVEDTFGDLRDAYRTIDQVVAERDELQQQLEIANSNIRQANENAKVKADDDARLKQAENLLVDLQQNVSQFRERRAEDAKQITELQGQLEAAPSVDDVARLQARVDELKRLDEQREEEYQELAADVNAVIDGLEAKFDAELTAVAG